MQVFNQREDEPDYNQGRRDEQTLYSQKAFFWCLIAVLTIIAFGLWEISLW